MPSAADCPLCARALGHPALRILRSEGEIIVPGCHASSWSELTATEQLAMLSLISTALQDGVALLRPDVIEGHFGLRLEHSDQAQVTGPLIAGGDDPLLAHLIRYLDRSRSVDLAVAFALDSGVSLILPWLEDLLDRGGSLRLVVGDYLDVTEPAALRKLRDLRKEGLSGTFEAHVFETRGGSFHPKAWLFRAAEANGATIVGSSNLSRSALTDGVEWNLHSAAPSDWQAVLATFEALLSDPRVVPLTDAWIDDYAKRRRARPLPPFAAKVAQAEPPKEAPGPHGIQAEALAALDASRRAGHSSGLVVLATGWARPGSRRSIAEDLIVCYSWRTARKSWRRPWRPTARSARRRASVGILARPRKRARSSSHRSRPSAGQSIFAASTRTNSTIWSWTSSTTPARRVIAASSTTSLRGSSWG